MPDKRYDVLSVIDNNLSRIPVGFLKGTHYEKIKQEIPVINAAVKNFLPRVKNIIAISSGKGGVGKSTVCLELAKSMANAGAKVGILDADIYGPSVPTLLNCEGTAAESSDQHITPLFKEDIYVSSIGFLVPPENALAWRGPMATGALMKLIQQTQWPDLDYLFIDMPPGTGDIQLTLAQKLPVTAAVVVTTPHKLAIADARKGCNLFEKVSIPIVGIIENMTALTCENCGHQNKVFGEGAGVKLSEELNVPLLAQIPLQSNVITDGKEIDTSYFEQAAESLAVKLIQQNEQFHGQSVEIEI